MISASVSVDPVYRSSQLCVAMLHNKRALTMINNYIKRYKVKREKEERKEQGELKIQLDQRLLEKKRDILSICVTHTIILYKQNPLGDFFHNVIYLLFSNSLSFPQNHVINF